MNNCYMIAFNKELRPITLNQNVLKVDYSELKKLTLIDSVTSKMSDEELRRKLFEHGIIESINTPLCIVNEKVNYGTKDIDIFRIITKDYYSSSLNNVGDNILLKFQELYYDDLDFKEIANFILGDDKIQMIFHLYGLGGRRYKLDYPDERNIVLSLNIYKKYHKLENYPEKDDKYELHKDEIIHLLSTRVNI